MKKTFSAIAVLKDSWKLFLANKKFYLEVVLVFGLIAVVADLLTEDGSMRLVDVVLSIINAVATWYGSMVLMKASLSIAAHKPIAPDVYSFTPSTIFYLILTSILTGLGVLIGTILLIIPGIMFALRSSLAQYIVLEEKLAAVPAIKKSLALTKGYSWSLLRLILCFIVLAVISVFPLFGLGFIILMPVSTLAISLVYRKLQIENLPTPQM